MVRGLSWLSVAPANHGIAELPAKGSAGSAYFGPDDFSGW